MDRDTPQGAVDRPFEILLITGRHPLWQKTLDYASSCSWRAGPYLARRMRENAFLDRERVIVAVRDGEIAGYCAFCEKDELPDTFAFSPFISFVFVDERFRGQRLSGRMIRRALRYAKELGYGWVYLMSGEKGLYEKYGFEKIGDYPTIYGSVDQLFRIGTARTGEEKE